MSGFSTPRFPDWLDIAIMVVEKFRTEDKRTRIVQTRRPILTYGEQGKLQLDPRPVNRVPNAPRPPREREDR